MKDLIVGLLGAIVLAFAGFRGAAGAQTVSVPPPTALQAQTVTDEAFSVLRKGVAPLPSDLFSGGRPDTSGPQVEAQSTTTTEFSIPTAFSFPYNITTGPDGNLWFTELSGNKIGRITPSGNITEFPVPSPAVGDLGPVDITSGPDGNLWFTEWTQNKIGRLNPQSPTTIIEFQIPTFPNSPQGITSGPDGNLWFTECGSPWSGGAPSHIGRITTSGTITEFLAGDGCPNSITIGPDGNLWFTDVAKSQIGRITMSGVITKFPVPSRNFQLYDITTGPDGDLWFSEFGAVGHITPRPPYEISEFTLPDQTPFSSSAVFGITGATDGATWFAHLEKIGRITPSGQITFPVVLPASSTVYGMTAGPDGNLWFLDNDYPVQKIGRITLAKRPVVIIPGIMGSELNRVDNNSRVWLDVPSLAERFDSFLFPLLLERDGATPDSNNRCAGSKQTCTSDFDCQGVLVNGICAPGGTAINSGGPLDLRDPVLNTSIYTAYSDLARFLRDTGGYTPGTNLFTFGYDWRLDLVEQAQRFRERLDARFPNPTDRVDVIAHSMGGLLIRAYLQLYPDDQRVASIIYLGTPQRGAPMAYAKLMGAASLVNRFNGQFGQFPFVLNLDTETFLVQNFPTAYALLPRFNFVLINLGPGVVLEPFKASIMDLPIRCSTPRLCGTLNSGLVTNANTLHEGSLAGPGRVPRSFGINGTGRRTLANLDYTNPNCPKAGSDPTGDGTVPSTSSRVFLDPSTYMYVDEEHKDLPGNPAVQQQILNILNGQEAVKAQGIRFSTLSDAEGWRWFSCSPILTHLTDEKGNTNGLDPDGNLHEDIKDSAHFRFAENEGGFMPFDKSYMVSIDATASGLVTLGFDHVAGPDDTTMGTTIYSGIPVSNKSHGQLTLTPTNSTPSLALDVDGDGAVDFTVPANAPPPPNVFPAVLIDIVQNLRLPHPSITQSLLVKLRAASASLGRGDTHAARGQLSAFLNQISAQRGKTLTPTQADMLTKLANAALHAAR